MMNKAEMDTTLQTKALYNSLRMYGSKIKESQKESKEDFWKTQEFRELELNQLFDALKLLGISLTKSLFYQWAAECETPEELLEFLFLEEGLEEEEESFQEDMKDHLYLLIFELWRRLVPEKRSLSIVADEIDHVIFAFDSGKPVIDEEIESALHEWVRILNRLQDEGVSATEALHSIESYFAHDVPSFIIDFLLDIADRGEGVRFQPLFEKVRPFLFARPLWVKVIDLMFCVREDILLVNKKLGDLVAHVLTTPQVESDIIFSLCDIALDLDREPLFLRLLERVLPDLTDKEDIELVIDLLVSFVEERSFLTLKASLENIEKARETKSISWLKEKLLQLILEVKNKVGRESEPVS
jgi:hypothetical protein